MTAMRALERTSYAYDLADRLVSITPPASSATTFSYDALGRIAGEVFPSGGGTSTFSYVGASDTAYAVSNSVTGTTNATLDAMGDRLAVQSGSTTAFTVADLHGNLAAELDSGLTSVLCALRFDPYGGTVDRYDSGSSFPTPWTYQGELDVSPTASDPLYADGARFYDPHVAAFTQLDAVEGSVQNPATLNRFLYAGANPTTYRDPSGHRFCGPDGIYCGYSEQNFGAGQPITAAAPSQAASRGPTGCAATGDCHQQIVAGAAPVSACYHGHCQWSIPDPNAPNPVLVLGALTGGAVACLLLCEEAGAAIATGWAVNGIVGVATSLCVWACQAVNGAAQDVAVGFGGNPAARSVALAEAAEVGPAAEAVVTDAVGGSAETVAEDVGATAAEEAPAVSAAGKVGQAAAAAASDTAAAAERRAVLISDAATEVGSAEATTEAGSAVGRAVGDEASQATARVKAAEPVQLVKGRAFEAQQLEDLKLSKNTRVWRPSAEQVESAAFRTIVGKPTFTPGGQPTGVIPDTLGLEIKGGSSALGSSYQLRLMTYRALIESEPLTILTTRPVLSSFADWLSRWGVTVQAP